MLFVILSGCEQGKVETYEVANQAPEGWPADAQAQQTAGSEQSESMSMPPASKVTPNIVQPPGDRSMQALPGMAEQSAQFDTPKWRAPDSWQPQPLGSMRKGSWLIERDGQSAELSVTVFPGDVGGDLANINRWAGQVGAPAIDDAQLKALKQTNTIEVDGLPALIVDLTGDSGKSIGGVILPRKGATWFFKMTGDTELVQAESVTFGRFMHTVHFH